MHIPSPLHGLTTLTLLTSLLTPSTTIPVSFHPLITTATPPHLKRRSPSPIQGFSLAKAAHIITIIPTNHAAALLADFYAEIHVHCITYWLPTLPPPNAGIVLQWGGFELSFVKSEGPSLGAGITWEFVRDFSALMYRVSERGYSGIYEQGWWDAAGELGVFVRLRAV